MNPLTLCDFSGSQFLLFGPNVAPLVYYSHLATATIALFLGLYLFSRDRRALPNQILFVITLAFSAWVLLDQVFWATNRSDIIMFTWAGTVLIEPLVHIAGLYLLYVLIEKRDMSFFWKSVLFVLYLPLIIFAPTNLYLSGFDLSSCLSVEGPIAMYYSYGLEIFAMIAVLIFAIRSFDRTKEWARRKEILALSLGVFFLLFAFSWGNIIGSFTDDWVLAQYGLFGMPVFIAFLMYTIVKYQTFNIKLVGAVALVLALIASSFALLFVNDVSVFREVASATFVLSVIFGIMLIRGVNREVEQREHIEKLAGELQRTNEQQEGLIHFIGHEVKGFLTKDEGAFAALVDGDFGTLEDGMKPFVENALKETRQGVSSVSSILKAANLKKGTVTYTKEPFDLKALAIDTIEKARVNAEQKGLSLMFNAEEGEYMMTGDKGQIQDHVLRNLIDNAINYTPSGSIAASVKKDSAKLVFIVKDTGVGISEGDKARLFTEGGHGKDSQTINVHSTGYGLFIAKQITEAHGGTIRAESEGAGKGSTFIVEFPV
jgi:signal transduction histidine kinase